MCLKQCVQKAGFEPGTDILSVCSDSVDINCVQQIASVTARPQMRCCQSCGRKLLHLCWEFWSALPFLDLCGKKNNVRLGRKLSCWPAVQA